MGFKPRHERAGNLLVERSAAPDHDVPGAEVRPVPAGSGLRPADVVGEHVQVLAPRIFQMLGDGIARKREAHEFEEAPLRRAAAQLTAPILGLPQCGAAVGFDLGSVKGGELAVPAEAVDLLQGVDLRPELGRGLHRALGPSISHGCKRHRSSCEGRREDTT